YPPGFPKCREDRGDCAYVNRKVIVARSYVDMLVGGEPEFSRPDDLSPRDRVGHGTAVAAIAAAVRNTGPAATVTGVAPAAWLGNYKVFGSPGVNGRYTYDDVVIQALNDALTDGMNVAVLSLGAPAAWGPRDNEPPVECRPSAQGNGPCDWRAAAVENAVAAGLAVVVSAGNDGDYGIRIPTYNSIHTPGSAPAAITVGATTNAHIWYQALRVNHPNAPADLRRVNALFGTGPRLAGPVDARVVDVGTLAIDDLACAPLPNGSLNGAWALIRRGDCQIVLKVQNAQRAGALGVILMQREGFNNPVTINDVEESGIPLVVIGNRSGEALRSFVRANSSATVTLDPALSSVPTQDSDFVAVFSSRGPSIRENAIKPEVSAPGTDLYVPTQRFDPNGEMYSQDGYTAVQGTSFAAPIVAGIAALVKQKNPSFTPAQLKSAVVNTADPRIVDYDGENRRITAGVMDVGAGRVDAAAALATNVTVEPSVLSFGAFGTPAPSPKGLRICNHGSEQISLRLSVVPTAGGTTAARVAANRTSFNLPRGCTEDVNVRLDGSRPGPGVYEGYLEITGGATPLRVPYLYLVGDGVPYNIFPLLGDAFEAEPDMTQSLLFKVVDRYGIPVPNAAVNLASTLGGGSIIEGGPRTDELGIGWADVRIGPELGEQEFYIGLADNRDFGMYVGGRARPRPSIASTGIVDAASGQPARSYAPGSYITLYGQGLSEAQRGFGTPYGPLALVGVSVSFEVPSQRLSVPGRVSFVSPSQINVLIPWELQGVSSALMKVSIGDSSSSLVTVPIASSAPSLFEFTDASGRRVVAAAGESGVITSDNGAVRGRAISLYVNGLGAVENQPASGAPGPSNPLARTRVAPQVTIAGRPAPVLFSGLAPGFVGLYQINVVVPEDVPAGLHPVVVTADGNASRPSTLVVR
ncbi:MAG TPA: S8 family serine peptidase, partial [Bryobacteraceae bacterium]|nr:S8 family serine peptidase [Bryobacteraceae bacterium]